MFDMPVIKTLFTTLQEVSNTNSAIKIITFAYGKPCILGTNNSRCRKLKHHRLASNPNKWPEMLLGLQNSSRKGEIRDNTSIANKIIKTLICKFKITSQGTFHNYKMRTNVTLKAYPE